MLNTLGLNNEDAELFEDFYTQLSKRFPVLIEDNIDLPLQKFQLFKIYVRSAYDQALQIYENFGKGYMLPIQVGAIYSSRSRSGTIYEYQPWGMVKLPKSFGHIFIKKENFRDRLIELFQPLEMNFPEDEEFSNRFYVLVKDQTAAAGLFKNQFRQYLMTLDDKQIQIEILDNTLLVGTCRSLGSSDFLTIAEFVKDVCNIHY